jgi:hypothetical protein
MANLPEARKDIALEDVAFRSSVSEAVGNKIGASINFINRRQTDKHDWHLNGAYALGVGSAGPDGIFVFPFAAEIVAYMLYSGTAGVSGTTTISIKRLDVGGAVLGDLFSTNPSVNSTAASGSFSMYRWLDPDLVSLPTGHAVGVITVDANRFFTEGQGVRLDLDSGMVGGKTLQATIYFRPSN